MIDFVGTPTFLRVKVRVAMETMYTFPSYQGKINQMHKVNIRVSKQKL